MFCSSSCIGTADIKGSSFSFCCLISCLGVTIWTLFVLLFLLFYSSSTFCLLSISSIAYFSFSSYARGKKSLLLFKSLVGVSSAAKSLE